MSSKIFTTKKGPNYKDRSGSAASIASHSSQLVNDTINLVCCSICKKDMCRPKHLPCIHSFCESCIEQCVQNQKDAMSTTHVVCPVCEMPSSSISHISAKTFSENLPSSTLVSTILSRKCASSPSCSRCKQRGRDIKASAWCGYCAQALCDEHADYHKDLTTTRLQHPVVKIKDMLNPGCFEFVRKCKYHPNEEMTHFCKEELTPCCTVCAKVMHKGCNVVYLHQVTTNIKMDPSTIRLRKMVDSLEAETEKLYQGRQQNINSLNEQMNSEREKLRNVREKLNSHLDEIEDNLVTELKTIHVQKITDLEKESRMFEIKNKTLNYYKKLLDSIQENSGNTQAIQELAAIRVQTKLIADEVKVVSSKLKWTDINIEYPYDLVKSISRLGAVQQRVSNINRTGTPSTTRSSSRQKVFK